MPRHPAQDAIHAQEFAHDNRKIAYWLTIGNRLVAKYGNKVYMDQSLQFQCTTSVAVLDTQR
jgi:hypothetical protein